MRPSSASTSHARPFVGKASVAYRAASTFWSSATDVLRSVTPIQPSPRFASTGASCSQPTSRSAAPLVLNGSRSTLPENRFGSFGTRTRNRVVYGTSRSATSAGPFAGPEYVFAVPDRRNSCSS